MDEETGPGMGQTASRERYDVSIVVPVYNEEESLPHLQERLVQALDALGRAWEIVYVDDGSKDGSLAILRRFAMTDRRVRVVAFRRNFGQTAALDAGFRHARGDILIPMDADLQNDPADIPRLIAKMEEGHDVVSGWRKDRKDKYLTRILPSRIANRLISKITGVHLHDYGCTLTAYRREIMQDVHLYGEMHRFIPVWANWAGGRVTELVVQHHPRAYGKTKYGLSRTFRVLLDLITVRFLVAYTTKPAYFFGKFAALSFGLAFLAFVWTLIEKFAFGTWVHNNPIFLIGIFFGLVGVQVIFVGLLAELNIRTHFESQHRPAYFVREREDDGGAGPGTAGPPAERPVARPEDPTES
jgi:glycosyltransferase involved in cell wall biosynthesis